MAYTVDWAEARARMNEEVDQQLAQAQKVADPASSGRSPDGRPPSSRGSDGPSGGGERGSAPGPVSGASGLPAAVAGVSRDAEPADQMARLEAIMSQHREKKPSPGQAYAEAVASGEAPFSTEPAAPSLGDRLPREDQIPSGPLRGFSRAEIEQSKLPQQTLELLWSLANTDPAMKLLLKPAPWQPSE